MYVCFLIHNNFVVRRLCSLVSMAVFDSSIVSYHINETGFVLKQKPVLVYEK